jgi:hypothetical protein
MRVRHLATAVTVVLLLVTGILSEILARPRRASADDNLSEASRIQVGLAAAPVPLNTHGKTWRWLDWAATSSMLPVSDHQKSSFFDRMPV